MDTVEIEAAKVSCAYCGAELFLPPCEERQHVQCPYCYSKCEYSNGLLYRLQGAIISQKEMRKVHTSCRPTAPKTIVLSVIMIYALAALGFIGTASQNFMAAASVGALLSGLGRGVQIGKGWTRIVLTIVIGATWVFSCAMNPVMGLVIALLWSSPVILIWLPGSCIWFGEMRIWYHEERLRHIESVKRRNAILIEIGILLLALICIYSSGLCQFALYNGIDAPLEWKMALLAFIPIMPILALLSFVGSMFCDDMPFWLGTLNIVLMGSGWGLLEEFCSRMKKKRWTA